MLVYDVTKERTFTNVSKWLRNIEEVRISLTDVVLSKQQLLCVPDVECRMSSMMCGMICGHYTYYTLYTRLYTYIVEIRSSIAVYSSWPLNSLVSGAL